MNLFFLRIMACIFAVGITLYAYIEKQNQLTSLRLRIPALDKQVKAIQEENRQLQFEIELFESPIHLMELARKPEFSHLKHPLLNEVIVLPGIENEEN